MLLGDVDLCARTRSDTTQADNENCDNENEAPHTPVNSAFPALLLPQHTGSLSRIYGVTIAPQK